jgi:hypothetical protein
VVGAATPVQAQPARSAAVASTQCLAVRITAMAVSPHTLAEHKRSARIRSRGPLRYVLSYQRALDPFLEASGSFRSSSAFSRRCLAGALCAMDVDRRGPLHVQRWHLSSPPPGQATYSHVRQSYSFFASHQATYPLIVGSLGVDQKGADALSLLEVQTRKRCNRNRDFAPEALSGLTSRANITSL